VRGRVRHVCDVCVNLQMPHPLPAVIVARGCLCLGTEITNSPFNWYSGNMSPPRLPHPLPAVIVARGCVSRPLDYGWPGEYAALSAHAGWVLYGMELGPVTLKRIGFFCFPIKHSTHTCVALTP
jgi:hypothetical protein